jgi:hypothetical protein
MKKLVLLVLFWGIAATLQAQSTAFTYQGKLNDNGTPASGIYDLRFTIYDAITNGNLISISQTNSALAVNNGLFTVPLDFGSGAFDGSARWLEIGIRTNGSAGAYILLSPRQPITSTPYAITAATAGNASNLLGTLSASQLTGALPATQLIGTLSDTQLSANIPKLVNGLLPDSALSTNIARVGSISGQIVSSLSVQAQPNIRYIVTNESQVTIQLPTNCNIGDTLRVVASGTSGGWKIAQTSGQTIMGKNLELLTMSAPLETNRNWRQIVCSADGTKILACASSSPLLVSTDSGNTWTPRESSRLWIGVASSADGQKLFAVPSFGKIYTSLDGGTNWAAQDSTRRWHAIACSSDGSRALAADNDSTLYTLSGSDTNWISRAGTNGWWNVAVSSSGAQMLATTSEAGGGRIYFSSDYGTNWVARDSNRNWNSICGSADFQITAATVFSGSIHISFDSSANWAATASGIKPWSGIACDSSGSILVASASSMPIYISTDYGTTWKPRTPSMAWTTVACSADGHKVYGAVSNGPIYALDSTQTETTAGTAGYIVGGRYTAIELQYLGGGSFATVSHEGTIQAF